MNMWKWNLAFQCMVNVGVRGSEIVRTRVVEADMVPVISTILDNYIKVIDHCREKAEEAMQAQEQRLQGSRSSENHESQKNGLLCVDRSSTSPLRPGSEIRTSRRQPPPHFIEIPTAFTNSNLSSPDALVTTPITHQPMLHSPPERSSFSVNRRRHHHHRGRDIRQHFQPPPRHSLQPLASTTQSVGPNENLNIRPVRDVDRLPSMALGYHNNFASQPETPMTPHPSSSSSTQSIVRPISNTTSAIHSSRRPSIRHHPSLLGEHRDSNSESMMSVESAEPEISGESTVSMESIANVDLNIQDISMDDGDSMLTAVESPLGLTMPRASNQQDRTEDYHPNHQSVLASGLLNDNTAPNSPALGFLPAEPSLINNSATMSDTTIPRYLLDRPINCHALAAMPRDEDVLMSLQLLAYVSKYCNLRSYFQKSHLVPKLKIGNELQSLDIIDGHLFSPSSPALSIPSDEQEEEEEYLLPDDFNIFPLVEKFTIRHHSQDMQYWAGVVMRNLCRKDESRGGIRQCANYRCGKWEEFTRQFAKCRRCRRTKYCSKECQKTAWIFHRHWCIAANP
ncbi:MYND-type zinc finger protein [Podosphaera aphanis]|nr:MYND-type zinc finger protein [Podosphaera aphanis]